MSLADMGTASRSTGGGGGGGGGSGGGRHYDLASGGGPAGGLPGGRMTHSLSTPSGVDGTPSTPRHRGGKKLTVRIQMLDDSVTMFQVQAKALGRVLFEQVCRQLNLLEADYFGLEYQEMSTHTKYWLDLEKPMNRQVGLSLVDPVLRFCIKFYTPDPAQLEEEYTRYLFCLQIKRDLATGSLQCNDNTAALMASYIVQASCGDFVPEDYPDHTYLSSYRFVPHQDASVQRKIMENHKKHVGQSPAEADLNLLETARRCELYGMKMHPGKDVEGVPLNLAVAHMGITVFQNITRINTFSWAKIRKISFKRKRFLVKLHPEGYGYYKDTVEFFFEGRNECKNFWKKCVENHGFFRCTAVQNTPRRKTRVLSRGSSFRYSGKTQKQIIEFVRENYVKRQNFQRSQSFRQGPLNASSRSQSHTYVNSSISANPLLPIDTATWDYRNQCSDSMTPSLTKKAADTLDRRRDNPIDHMRSQVTAAQVEIYQTKNYAAESPTSQEEAAACSAADRQLHSAVAMDQMNSNRSLSPQGPQSWTSPSHSSSHHQPQPQPPPRNAPDQARAHPGDHNLGLSHLSHLYSSSTPRRVSVGSQAFVPASPQLISISTHSTHNANPNANPSISINNNNTMPHSTLVGGHSVDLSSSMELEEEEEEFLGPADTEEEAEEEPMGEEEELVEEEADSDLTASTINRETITGASAAAASALASGTSASALASASAHRQPLRSQESQSQTVTPVHYSSTNYSMSKQCMLNNANANANSTETETDNIIYTDINDMGHYKYPDFHSTLPHAQEHKISNSEHLNLNERNDIYATVNRKAKSKTREKHFSDEFIDQSIIQYARAKQMGGGVGPPLLQQPSTSAYAASVLQERNYNGMSYNQYHNDLNHPSESSSSSYFGTGFGTKRYAGQSERVKLAQSENYLTPSMDSQSSRHTHSLPRNSELSGVDSVDSYDSHYITHHSVGNLPPPRQSSSSEKLEYQLSSGNLYSTAQFVKPEEAAAHYMDDEEEDEEDADVDGENIYDQVERESWLKSSSCKDLFERYSSTYYDREHPKPMTVLDKEFLSSNRIDSPVTRYDDSRHSLYITKNHSIDAHQDFSPLPQSKVYSSSYPGSTYNAQDKRHHGQHLDYSGSQDDISQDSYELLEKVRH
ncbi:GL21623 [Drosophila persimilis]|uniref:Moesin/ezrin/radixin homolog 1 n=1 Tax=Drosophila persimilis TaxID=7234 RepID=B4GFH6_DROPE|nr:GL21623 [Drosophila persimilis]